jgi:6-phosphogluconolactonase
VSYFVEGQDGVEYLPGMKKTLLLTAAVLAGTAAQGAIMDVYFGTGGDATRGIYHATFDAEKGRLSEAQLAAEIGSPGFLALHPDRSKLYAVGRLEGEGVVVGYQVNPSGALAQFTASPIRDGGGTHLAVHPSGRLLLTAQYGGGSTALFSLDRDGRLGESVISEHEGGAKVVPGRQETPHPHWCGFSPDGQFAFVPDLGLDGIVIYRVDQEAPAIRKHGFAASVPGGGPRHMRFSVDGKFIYLLNELSLSVTTFRYDPEKGAAARLSTTPSLSPEAKAKEVFNSAAEILVHPNGRFVYSSNRGSDTVTAYLANPATGQLTVTEVEPIRGAWPRNINLDPSGRWLLAAGAHSNTVSVFAIDQATGELTYQRQSIINVPGPICVLFVE